MKKLFLTSTILAATFFLSQTLLSEEKGKPGPRFDYYKLRGKPMRHGLLFQAHGEAKGDDIKLQVASVKNGKKVYQQLCIHCHGPDGKGDGKMGNELVLRPADLSKLIKQFPAHHFFMQISDGLGRDMPAWQDALEPKEIWDLIAYIKTLKK